MPRSCGSRAIRESGLDSGNGLAGVAAAAALRRGLTRGQRPLRQFGASGTAPEGRCTCRLQRHGDRSPASIRIRGRSPPGVRTMSTPPFHLAFPVHDLAVARAFYGGVLQCPEGRSSEEWVDFNLYGHQIVAHLAPQETGKAGTNAVDGDQVPV